MQRLYYNIKNKKFIEAKDLKRDEVVKGEVIATTSEKEAIELLNTIINTERVIDNVK